MYSIICVSGLLGPQSIRVSDTTLSSLSTACNQAGGEIDTVNLTDKHVFSLQWSAIHSQSRLQLQVKGVRMRAPLGQAGGHMLGCSCSGDPLVSLCGEKNTGQPWRDHFKLSCCKLT